MALKELLLVLCIVTATPVHAQQGDSIVANKSLISGQSIVSAGKVFEMGFFSPGNPELLFLGIWYKERPPVPTVVWIANRNSPVNSSRASLNLTSDGNLIIVDGAGNTSWSTGTSNAINPILQLLDTGNLVLTDGTSQNILWQSFDHPHNTLLPGMKLGFDFSRNLDKPLTSWKSPSDPSTGAHSYKIDTSGVPEIYLWKGTSRLYRSGPWTGHGFSGRPEMNSKESRDLFTFQLVDDQHEVSYSFEVVDNSSVDATRVVLNETGVLQRYIWSKSSPGWSIYWQVPNDVQCDKYAGCGANTYCISNSTFCRCLDRFKPASPMDWSVREFSGGCSRQSKLDCQTEHEFLNVAQVKLPDTLNAEQSNRTLEDCKNWCLSSCTCTAYSAVQGSGCITWTGPLLDLRMLPEGGDTLYYRVAASDLAQAPSGDHPHKKKTVVIILIPLVVGFSILVFVGLLLWKKYTTKSPAGLLEAQDFPLFSLDTIKAATNNFSMDNKLGQGCFGEVFKGRLKDGQEIAAKKLSKYSLQGTDEFKNELLLITQLQHRNLVRLLGCCIEGDDRILIYEHMENKSLDTFVFDRRRASLLNWLQHIDVILGIARGLLYLHQDSRLNIIHRDLKPSNILLDKDMNPKISDFGIARIFEGDQSEQDTATRVVGTIGYMSPEYTKGGIFSVKSDVFSFGVVVLEILSGRRNNASIPGQPSLSLVELAWRVWQEGRSVELLDGTVGGSYPASEVSIRCIHVGLLCVQEKSEDRPTMREACQMLASLSTLLPQPRPPSLAVAVANSSSSFFAEREQERDWSSSTNEITITVKKNHTYTSI